MAYQIKILMLAFAIAFVISLIVIPILRRRKIGQQERDDGPKSHLKKQGTPTMGGIVMILAIIIIGAIVFLKYSKSIDASEQTMAKNLIPLILVTDDKSLKLKSDGKLADLAPTMLDLMNLDKPDEMTGTSLLSKE